MQRQISNWRKELLIITETQTDSDNGKLNRNRRKQSDKCRRIFTVGGDNEAESASQSPKNLKIRKKGKPSISRIRCSKKTPKNFTETWT